MEPREKPSGFSKCENSTYQVLIVTLFGWYKAGIQRIRPDDARGQPISPESVVSCSVMIAPNVMSPSIANRWKSSVDFHRPAMPRADPPAQFGRSDAPRGEEAGAA
jgi:hypothetical protein